MGETRRAGALRASTGHRTVSLGIDGMLVRAAATKLNARQIGTPSGAPLSAKTVIRARGRLL